MRRSEEKHSSDSVVLSPASLGADDGLLKIPRSGSAERLQSERRLVRKLDMRLLPMIFVIFIINYIDRNGITTARLKGMQQDLHINDVQYATVIAILFASYCPAQIPSNMILNKVNRPSIYIGVCTVIWGITSALTGTYPNAKKARVLCIDIGSRLFPAAPPPNTTFQINNVLDMPTAWNNRFALVHQRLLIDALKYDEWKPAIEGLYRVTAPGGWAQFCEANVVTHMVNFGPVTNRFMELYEKLGRTTGHDFLCSLRIAPLMREAGFVNVHVEHRLTPFGEWNGEMGVKSAKNTIGVFRGFKTPILNMGGLGLVKNEKEYDTLMDDVEAEWKTTPGPAVGWYIIVGQK